MPQVSTSRSLYYQLWRAAPVDQIQREGVDIACQLLERKDEGACLQPWVAYVEDRHDAVVTACFTEIKLPSKPVGLSTALRRHQQRYYGGLPVQPFLVGAPRRLCFFDVHPTPDSR